VQLNFSLMDKWLKMGNIQRTNDDEVPASVSVEPVLVCDKPNVCDEIRRCRKVVCQENKV
jgi:hypothetical protein